MSQRQNVNGPLVWSGLFIGAAVVVLAFMTPSLANALFSPTIDEPETVTRIAKYLDRHEDVQATYRDRFSGRSIFFKPRQPVAPAKPVTPKPRTIEEEPKEPRPEPPKPEPKKPAYSGPPVQAILGEEVWFQGTDNPRIRIGESDKGLTVLSTNPPWTVKVEYRGWEYELSLFNANAINDFFITEPKPAAPLPGMMEVLDEKPETPTPDEPRADEDEDADDGGAEPSADGATPVISPNEDPSRPPKGGGKPDVVDPEKDGEGASEKPDAEGSDKDETADEDE